MNLNSFSVAVRGLRGTEMSSAIVRAHDVPAD